MWEQLILPGRRPRLPTPLQVAAGVAQQPDFYRSPPRDSFASLSPPEVRRATNIPAVNTEISVVPTLGPERPPGRGHVGSQLGDCGLHGKYRRCKVINGLGFGSLGGTDQWQNAYIPG
uniref:Uncharacterized protein n=1 Tax=Steinernema glaseri TaxID=37863 RepID=A0A1I7ZZW5_9BILA